MTLFHSIAVFYVGLSISFMLFKAVTAIINTYQRKNANYNMKKYPLISIIVPVYNENKNDLIKCLDSVCNNDYKRKEVYVINDGSSKEITNKTLLEYASSHKNNTKYYYINLKKNVGKREAMYLAIKRCKGEFIVVVDSDSIARDGDSLRELIKPFSDKNIDAVSGMTYAENENYNVLTKMQAGRYALAFEMEKAGQATYGSVTCCPGCYSAYRKSAVLKIIDEWRAIKTSFGDDRSLTRLILHNGGKVVYSSTAVSYTNVPDTYKGFFKQQIRWKRSFFSEHYMLAKGWKKLNYMARLELVWFVSVWVGGYFAKISVLYALLTSQVGLVQGLGIYLAISMVHYAYVFIRYAGTMRGFYGGLYGFLNDLGPEWLAFYSLFTLSNNSWGTR